MIWCRTSDGGYISGCLLFKISKEMYTLWGSRLNHWRVTFSTEWCAEKPVAYFPTLRDAKAYAEAFPL